MILVIYPFHYNYLQEFEEYFETFLQDGKDVLHVCLSSGISGTYNSANIARDTLMEKYPDRKNRFGIFLCVMCIFFGGAAECTMSQWASGFMENAVGIPKVWGDILGMALFAFLLGLGRSLKILCVDLHGRYCLVHFIFLLLVRL